MTLFEGLLMGHIVGDWLLQTEWQALNKATKWRAMISHIAIYHAVLLGVLMLWLSPSDPRIYAAVGLLAVTHTIIDRRSFVTSFMRVMRLTVVRTQERWLALAVDQAFHLLLLGVTAYALAA